MVSTCSLTIVRTWAFLDIVKIFTVVMNSSCRSHFKIKKGEKLEFEFVGDFRRDVFEGTRSPRDPLEAHSVQAQPRQFTHLTTFNINLQN